MTGLIEVAYTRSWGNSAWKDAVFRVPATRGVERVEQMLHCFLRCHDNVDPSTYKLTRLESRRARAGRKERAFPGGKQPSEDDVEKYADSVIAELQAWGFIGPVEVVDPTWIEVAYTWSWPNSSWKHDALRKLAAHGVEQVGRYARWTFQGIAASIKQGLRVGSDGTRTIWLDLVETPKASG
jgi:hypothetical protein